jgi:O-antigen/teichoic acid export membrane protein
MGKSFGTPFRHLADGTVRLFLAEALILPTGFITTVFLTRTLGPGGYGLFTLSITLFLWASVFANSLFTRSTIKFVSETNDWRQVATTSLRLHLITGVCTAMLLWYSSKFTASFLGEPKLETYLKLFAFEVLVLSLVQAHRSIIIGIGHFRERAVASAIRWPARLFLIVLFVEMGLSVSGAILGSIGATVVELFVYRLYARPSLFSKSVFPVRKLLSYAPPLLFFAIFMQLFSSIDVFALKALGGTANDAGIYGAAQNLSIIPTIFATSFSPLLLSSLGHLIKSEQIKTARKMGGDAMRLILCMLPFAAMASGAAREVVALVFGQAFAATAPLLSLLIFAKVAIVIITVAAIIMISAGQPGWTLAIGGPVLIIAGIGHLLMIPKYGALGAALVTTLVASGGALAAMVAVYSLWSVYPRLGTVARTLFLSALAYSAATFWQTPGAWVILKLLAITTVIALGYRMLGEFNSGEREFLRSFFSSQLQPKQNP